MTKNLKNWLQTANGWKRMWFALSSFGLFYMTAINPFVVSNQNSASSYQYRWAVERELKNPECRPYSTTPFLELAEPPYQDSDGNKGCYHLYNYRKYTNPEKVPYTTADLDRDFKWKLWSEVFALSGLGAVIAAIVSAVVYFLGSVVAWVMAGFRKSAR